MFVRLKVGSETDFPGTLVEAVKYFGEGDNAFDLAVKLRWPDGVRCPRCRSRNVGPIATRRMWECKECTSREQFTVRVGTVLEDSALSLATWLTAVWMIARAKDGVSSYEVHRSIGVTQKTAWLMLRRIHLAMEHAPAERLEEHGLPDDGLGRNPALKSRLKPQSPLTFEASDRFWSIARRILNTSKVIHAARVKVNNGRMKQGNSGVTEDER
jgi:transposase-like protein